MVSVNTNAAAITALRTLQQTNASLDKTQNRISTGYKIGEAKDNAAYWAISTTLKSDNKSLGTVKDALGLGASTVDVMYQGLNKAKDVLDELKAKLTAATQDGVNRDTIQDEIEQFQDQLKSIATSSVFSGENWLSVDSSVTGFNPEKQVVASFSRATNGSVSIGTIKVQTAQVALFDASSASGSGGIVNGSQGLTAGGRDLSYGGVNTSTGNTSAAGLGAASDTGTSASAVSGTGTAAVQATASLGTFTTISSSAYAALGSSDGITITVTTDKASNTAITVTKADLVDANSDGAYSVDEFISAFNAKTAASTTAGVQAYLDGTTFKLRRIDGGELKTLTSVTAAAAASGSTFGLNASGSGYTTGSGEAKATSATLDLSGLATTDKFDMTFKFNGAVKTFTVDPTDATSLGTIVTALNTSSGGADGFDDYAVASAVSGKLVITGKNAGAGQSIELTNVVYKDSSDVVKEPTTATHLPYAEMAQVKTTFSAVGLDDDDKIQFDLKLNGATSSTLVTIDKALVNEALNVTTGTIGTSQQYATVLNAALTKAGVTGLTATAPSTGADVGKVVLSTALKDATAKIDISNVTATAGTAKMSVDKIDISDDALGSLTSDQIKNVLSAYIDVVNTAINKVTSAASSLGSVASRIDLQKSFVDTLMDTIDKGVGNLVDADMSEESTKLQALQVKQQLGVQALSIANQSSQNILSLFQSGG